MKMVSHVRVLKRKGQKESMEQQKKKEGIKFSEIAPPPKTEELQKTSQLLDQLEKIFKTPWKYVVEEDGNRISLPDFLKRGELERLAFEQLPMASELVKKQGYRPEIQEQKA